MVTHGPKKTLKRNPRKTRIETRSTNEGAMYYDHVMIKKKKPQDYRNDF